MQLLNLNLYYLFQSFHKKNNSLTKIMYYWLKNSMVTYCVQTKAKWLKLIALDEVSKLQANIKLKTPNRVSLFRTL